MQSRKLSLKAVMGSWMGQQIIIKAQGPRITLVQKKPTKNKRSQSTIGLFKQLADTTNYRTYTNANNNNHDKQNHTKNEQQYIIKANQRIKNNRVSLADLGQIYNDNKIKQNIQQRRKSTQIYTNNQNKNNKSRYSANIKQGKIQNYHSGNSSRFMQYGNRNALEQIQTKYDRNVQNQYNTAPINKYHINVHHDNTNNYKEFNMKSQENQNIQKIKQSINQIRLPDNTKDCPQYATANDRFQRMKRQILQKVIQSGQINELSDILKQIRQAADQIIARHYQQQPKLKKNCMFSFKDLTNPQNQTINPILNPIVQENDERSQNYINLPQFKDDAGSISSILSLNGYKKDQSKDQDFCKIDNVLICDTQNYNHIQVGNHAYNQESSLTSIKPIVLEDDSKKEQTHTIKQSKNNFNGQSQYSMVVKDTILQSNANNLYNQSKLLQKPQIKPLLTKQSIKESVNKTIKQSVKQSMKNDLKFQHAYLFNKKQQPSHALPNTTQNKNIFGKKQKIQTYQTSNKPAVPPTTCYINQNYHLERITEEPVKIIKNLEQAKKFDPEITKFTQLKIKYLETRTTSPKIMKIPSTMGFMRKQEVVKCLVANQIVQKQSNSIQF